jgi:hypothetical protein
MENSFITYQQAEQLKKLGFDEECFAIYDEYEEIVWNTKHSSLCYNSQGYVDMCTAPTYSQAFRWFREKYNLYHNVWNYTHGEPTDLIPNGFTYSIDEEWITIIGKKEDGYFEKYYNTYEEAELACLQKLIEIVKNK